LKSARTVYAVETVVDSLKASKLCLVKCAPRTGRTHQLRRHFAEALGRPIVGDVLYDGGGPEALNFRRSGLFLCARSLELDHPVTGARLQVRTGLPGKFSSLLEREARRAAALGDG
jgi:23S rRNA-/tRNA-specific pseudouridylate synthase